MKKIFLVSNGAWVDKLVGDTLTTWHDKNKSDLKEYYQQPSGDNWESLSVELKTDMTFQTAVDPTNLKSYIVLRRPKDIGH